MIDTPDRPGGVVVAVADLGVPSYVWIKSLRLIVAEALLILSLTSALGMPAIFVSKSYEAH